MDCEHPPQVIQVMDDHDLVLKQHETTKWWLGTPHFKKPQNIVDSVPLGHQTRLGNPCGLAMDCPAHHISLPEGIPT